MPIASSWHTGDVFMVAWRYKLRGIFTCWTREACIDTTGAKLVSPLVKKSKLSSRRTELPRRTRSTGTRTIGNSGIPVSTQPELPFGGSSTLLDKEICKMPSATTTEPKPGGSSSIHSRLLQAALELSATVELLQEPTSDESSASVKARTTLLTQEMERFEEALLQLRASALRIRLLHFPLALRDLLSPLLTAQAEAKQGSSLTTLAPASPGSI